MSKSDINIISTQLNRSLSAILRNYFLWSGRNYSALPRLAVLCEQEDLIKLGRLGLTMHCFLDYFDDQTL